MGLAEIKADIQLATESINSATSLDELKQQIADNLIPLMTGLADATKEELAQRDEVLSSVVDDIDQLVDQEGDVLQPETSTKILAVIEGGKLLATELELLLKKADDVTRKRVAPLIKSYRQGSIVVAEMLAEITIPLDPEEESTPAAAQATPQGDEDEDDEDEDDDEDLDDVEEG